MLFRSIFHLPESAVIERVQHLAHYQFTLYPEAPAIEVHKNKIKFVARILHCEENSPLPRPAVSAAGLDHSTRPSSACQIISFKFLPTRAAIGPLLLQVVYNLTCLCQYVRELINSTNSFHLEQMSEIPASLLLLLGPRILDPSPKSKDVCLQATRSQTILIKTN